MSSQALTSVILVNRNGEPFLCRAIGSVTRQSYPHWEMIIVDNESPDGSWETIQRWAQADRRVSCMRGTVRQNVSKAANSALTRAAGSYVARIDSDDIWLRTRMEKQVALLEEQPEVGLCGTDGFLLDQSGAMIGDKRYPTTDRECRRAFWFRNPFCQSAILARKQCFDRYGCYDEPLKVADHLELWFRFGQGCRLFKVPECLVKYPFWMET